MAARMPWQRRALALFLLASLRLSGQIWAQTSAPADPGSPYSETAHPTPERIATLLKSGDPRDRAWGAYHAVRTNDGSFLPELTGLAERWEPLPHPAPGQLTPAPDARQRSERDTMVGVLDGVIQFKGTLSPRVLLALAGDLPAQVAILLARLSPSEAEPTLMAIFNDPKPGNWQETRFAAQMLMLRPPPTFAAKLMHDMKIPATIFVIDSGGGMGTGHGGSCGIGNGVALAPGWPSVGQYTLLEYPPNEKLTLLPIMRGRHPLFASRVSASGYMGVGCGMLRPLGNPVRIELLAQMVGSADKGFGLSAELQTNIVATTTADYEKGLTAYVTTQLDAFEAVERRLTAKGYVSLDEMASKAAEPELALAVLDYRKDKSFDLPKIVFSRGRVVWEGK